MYNEQRRSSRCCNGQRITINENAQWTVFKYRRVITATITTCHLRGRRWFGWKAPKIIPSLCCKMVSNTFRLRPLATMRHFCQMSLCAFTSAALSIKVASRRFVRPLRPSSWPMVLRILWQGGDGDCFFLEIAHNSFKKTQNVPVCRYILSFFLIDLLHYKLNHSARFGLKFSYFQSAFCSNKGLAFISSCGIGKSGAWVVSHGQGTHHWRPLEQWL